MPHKFLSIVVTHFNKPKEFELCLNSIFKALKATTLLEEQYEIIIIDDCSTSKSKKQLISIIQDLEKSSGISFKPIYLEENIGLGPVRNLGLKMAQGDYIHFMDGDDEILPSYYSQALQITEKYPHIDVVWTGRIIYDVQNKYLYTTHYYNQNLQFGLYSQDDFYQKNQSIRLFDVSATNIYRVDFLRTRDIHFKTRFFEDNLFFMDIVSQLEYGFYFLPEPLYLYKKYQVNTITNMKSLNKKKYNKIAKDLFSVAYALMTHYPIPELSEQDNQAMHFSKHKDALHLVFHFFEKQLRAYHFITRRKSLKEVQHVLQDITDHYNQLCPNSPYLLEKEMRYIYKFVYHPYKFMIKRMIQMPKNMLKSLVKF